MDAIDVKGLRVEAHVGVTETERSRPQTVVVDVRVSADLKKASTTDDLAHTIDYAAVSALIVQCVSSKRSSLLEHLAGEIADALLGFQGVRGVTVQIAKEPPPVSENVDRIAVTIERLPR